MLKISYTCSLSRSTAILAQFAVEICAAV